jgi:hypothetical protein
MAKTNVNVGSSANDGTGDPLRTAFTSINSNTDEIYSLFGNGSTLAISGDASVSSGALTIANDAVENDMLEPRFTDEVSITTLTGTVSFNCALGSIFKLSGDLTGAYTISLTGYKKGQIITIYPIKGNQTLNLAGAGSSSNTFNKIGGVNYNDDGSTSNILQIECVDDSATAPIFFYSIATFAEDSSDI